MLSLQTNLTFWGTFQDPQTEERFQQASYETQKGLFLYVLVWPGIWIVALMIRTDWLLFGHDLPLFSAFMVARAVFLGVSFLTLYWVHKRALDMLSSIAAFWLTFILFFMFFMLWMRPLNQPNHVIVQSLSLLFLMVALPHSMPSRAFFLGAFSLSAIIILAIQRQQIDEPLWSVYSFSYLFAFVLGFLFTRQQNRLERTNYHHLLHERALTQELERALSQIQTLRDLIPLCASCKSVRDDDGYWKEVEEYLDQYTNTSITHSICPACAQRLYPDLYPEEASPPHSPSTKREGSALEPK